MKHIKGKMINFQGISLLSGFVGLTLWIGDFFENLMKAVDLLTRKESMLKYPCNFRGTKDHPTDMYYSSGVRGSWSST